MATHFLNCDFVLNRLKEKGDIFDVYGRCILKNTSPHIKIKSLEMQLSGLYDKTFPWIWEIKGKHRNNIVPHCEDYIWCHCDMEIEILQTIITGDVFTFLEECLKDNSTKNILYAGVNAIFHDKDEMSRFVNNSGSKVAEENEIKK